MFGVAASSAMTPTAFREQIASLTRQLQAPTCTAADVVEMKDIVRFTA
jgi:hypothetical protein